MILMYMASALQELDEEELVDVKEGLSKLLKPGEKLLLTQIVDPVIIGGFIVDIGVH